MYHGAFIPLRYSTSNQKEDSLEVQLSACMKWCEEHSLPVLDVFPDAAISGMKETRPQYERMMGLLKAGGADTVVVYDQSRLFRNISAWFSFRDQMDRMGIRVVSVTQPLIGGDLRDPATFMSEGTMAIFNHMWALQTRQKVIEKMRFMANNRLHTGGVPPLGYRVEDNRLVICEEEAAIVRLIFSRYASGVSYRQIIAELNELGHRTKAGKPFGTNSLHDLLRNEKYIGVLIYGATQRRSDGTRNMHGEERPDAIRIEDGCPRIIDRDTWEKVQKKMVQRQHQKEGRPATVRDYPLRGKVFCGECGHAMTILTSNRRYHYYHCNEKKRTGQCDCPQIRADRLEDMISEAIRSKLRAPGNFDHLIGILKKVRAEFSGSAVTKLQQLMDHHKEVSAKLESGMQAVLSGLHSPTLNEKISQLEIEKATAELRMKELRAEMDAVSLSDAAMRDLLLQIIGDCSEGASLLAIVRRVKVWKDRIRIWTLLDPDYDGDPDDDPDETPIDFPADELINNPGDASPAPTLFITSHFLIFDIKR